MFKKAFEAKIQQRLSGADKKKLRRTLRDKFPRASDSDLDALLPPKVQPLLLLGCLFTAWFGNAPLSLELALLKWHKASD